MNDDTPTPERPVDERSRYSGYRPRRPTDPPAAAMGNGHGRGSAPPRSASAGRTSRRRTLGVGLATLLATAAFVVGLMLGWMARGGPPNAELVVTTQPVPAVTVTREVAP